MVGYVPVCSHNAGPASPFHGCGVALTLVTKETK